MRSEVVQKNGFAAFAGAICFKLLRLTHLSADDFTRGNVKV